MDIIELANKVIEQANIVDVVSHYLPVIKTGINFKAVCPFHDDTNPSLTISPSKKIFKCFVCGTGGNAITFVQKYENISFKESIKRVAEICHISLPEISQLEPEIKIVNPYQKEVDAMNFIAKFYGIALSSEAGKLAKEYVLKRKITEEQILKFQIGFSPINAEDTSKFLVNKGISLKTQENIGLVNSINSSPSDRFSGRVIFPIADENGNVVGFSGRFLGTDKSVAKYINSPESVIFVKSKVLYNFSEVKRVAPIKRHVYICEGFMDVIALDRYQIPSVATMGTSLSKDHFRLLRTLKCPLKVLMDGDGPGRLASLKISRTLFLNGFDVVVVHQKGEARDPDEIIRDLGDDGLRKYLSHELSYLSYVGAYYEELINDATKKLEYVKLAHEAYTYLFSRDAILADKTLKDIARFLRTTTETVQTQFKRLSKTGQDAGDQADKYKGFARNNSGISSKKDFVPEIDRAAITGLRLKELHLISMILQSREAVGYFKDSGGVLNDTLYNDIAQFVMNVYQQNETISIAGICNLLENNENVKNKTQMLNEIETISLRSETDKDAKFSEKACSDLVGRIVEEQKRLSEVEMQQTVEKNVSPEDALRLRQNSKKAKVGTRSKPIGK